MKHLCSLSILLLASQFCNAQSNQLPDPEAYFSAIIVSNADSSSLWYSKVLGFAVAKRTVMEERGITIINMKRGDVLIELLELPTSISKNKLLNGQKEKAYVQGLFKFGLRVNEFDTWAEHLTKLKVEMRGSVVINPDDNKKMVIIIDPDGNYIQLFEK